MKVKSPKKKSSDDMGNLAVAKEEERQEKTVVATAAAEGEGEGEEGEDWEVEGRGRTVVVGVRMDAQSKELLTWALVKVAQSGDRVIALHVLPNSSSSTPSSFLSLITSFESVLSVYQGFCNLKQIYLKLKVCRGSSLRKALVREAAAANAAQLILGGAAKGNHGFRSSSSVSVAKYCAKKVPNGCGVAAVSNGKVIFERSPSQPSPQPGVGEDRGSNGRSRKNEVPLDAVSNDNLFCLLPNWSDASKSPSSGAFVEDGCSVCSEAPDSAQAEGDDVSTCGEVREEGDGTSSSEALLEGGDEAGVTLQTVQEEQRGQQGWPMVRRLGMLEGKLSLTGNTTGSVMQWAMRLPSRYWATAAVHPAKTEKNEKRDAENEKQAESDQNDGGPKFSKELESLGEKYASVCRLFTCKELSDATIAFSAENLIGKGGNSCVYKGCLPDGRELAVKVLKQTEDSMKEFSMELEIITSLCHKNIVSLVGFGFNNNKFFLVYDLFSRGSLDRHLHDVMDGCKSTLGWDERYKIAIGVAEALEYLHDGSGRSQPVIHRDVKSSNILLSQDFQPQLSDFGFATWSSSSSSIIACTNVAGTFGYLAPEYFLFGKVNEKIDVYAFGVVLLELLTGRKPIGRGCPKGQESLVVWAKPFLQNGKTELLDPRLGTKYDADQVERMMLATALCTRRTPKLRPGISPVLKLLLGDEDTIKSARSQVEASEELEGQDDEVMYPAPSNLQSHLNLALLDVEDDSLSTSSASHSISNIMARGPLEAYFQGRCIHSSSFD